MKNTRLKLFPLMLMLIAGSITSIMTYHFQYELKTALLVLLSVLLVFYIMGLILVSTIENFDKKNEEALAAEEARLLEAEENSEADEMSENVEEEDW